MFCLDASWKAALRFARQLALSTVTLLFAAILPAAAASAAQITVRVQETGPAVIVVKGAITLPDAVSFLRKTHGLNEAIVVFDSSGGNVAAAIAMGRTIRNRGFATTVPPAARCLSACALAWLAGTPRRLAHRSRVGFHSAYFAKSGRARKDQGANARTKLYLKDIGISDRAISFVTSSPLYSYYWITLDGAPRVGIEVEAHNRM